MTKRIDYTTIKQQIEMLKAKGLLFSDEDNAQTCLERYGYYNIINSYKEPYQHINNSKKEYIPGTTFEQIYSLFTLDHNLRNSIMSSMPDLEECLRAAAAEVIAHSFGTDHNRYLKFQNYRDRHSRNPKFSLTGILDALKTNSNSDKDPIRYYRENYTIVPPWILLKGTYFSVLINLIKCFKNKQKQQLIRILLELPPDTPVTEEIITFFQNVLYICLDYRNTAAHGGRIYNYESSHVKKIIVSDELIEIFPTLKKVSNASGISMLLILLSIFKYGQPSNIIHRTLDAQLNRHLNKYPNDINILSTSIKIPIYKNKYVWINTNTKTYHINKYCSGMTNAEKFPYNNIVKINYKPCKRCIGTTNK